MTIEKPRTGIINERGALEINSVYSDAEISVGSLVGNTIKGILGNNYMSEAQLTEDERESRIPLKTSDYGYYRMYKWTCSCKKESVRMPFTKAMIEGNEHAKQNPRHRKIKVVGGVFEKEMLYK